MAEHDDGNVNESVDQRIDTKLAEFEHEHDAGVTEARVREILDEYDSGSLTRDETIALIEEYGGFPKDRLNKLDSLIARAEETLEEFGSGFEADDAQIRAVLMNLLDELDIPHHADALDFPSRRVGPSEPTGDYHQVPMWGLHLRTGRECYIRSAVVDANESGTFRVQLGTYDGADAFGVVDETEVSVSGDGAERISLGLQVPDEGEYLLAVPDGFPLRRGEWNGWDNYMVDNLRLIGGSKPGDWEKPNDYFYKLFDIEMTATEDHEFSE